MRRRFEKSLCKCPRCVAKRRIRFFTLSGVCITIAAGCYILVDHSKHVAPPSLNMPEALVDEPASDASAVPKGNWEQASRALAEPATSGKEQDIETTQESSVATGPLELKKNLTHPDGSRNRGALPSSNPIGEAPMPHTHGWQTVPLADASKIDIQGPSQPGGAKVAAVPAESSSGPTFGEPTVHPAAAETGLRKDDEDVLMAYRADPYELLPRWLKELAGDPKSDIPKSKTAEVETVREPVVAQSATPESTPEADSAASGETIDGADTGVATTAAVSPAPARAESASAGTPDTGKGGTPEDVAVLEKPDLHQPLPAQPKETDLASRSKPDEALTSGSAGSAQNLASESKERDPKPPETSARLFASLESNSVMHSEDSRKPTGYITIESKPEAPQNLGTEDHPPKPQDHSQKVQERRLTVQEYPSKVQDHPLKAPDKPPKAEEKSGDLQRFALAFLQTDQTGNIADQHRFYADSVHFYREGDLSWSGVAAATRRYHQERQNKRYGTEGSAAVTGPIDGGFYVVEQPVSWSRKEGSRQIRGKSVLRLRVVPTGRGDWRITSIDEIGQ